MSHPDSMMPEDVSGYWNEHQATPRPACRNCGLEPQECDDDCHRCFASLYIVGAEVYDPNQQAAGGGRLWDLEGFDRAEQMILAAKREAA